LLDTLRRFKKMKQSKISARHFLNKLITNESGDHPVYVRVRFKRKSMILSSGIEGYFSNLDEVLPQLIKVEVLLITEEVRKSGNLYSLKGFFRQILPRERKVVALHFFKWFRENGEKHIGTSIEDMVDIYVEQ
jgi:hypothetical protein